jgi:hypothetical protein
MRKVDLDPFHCCCHKHCIVLEYHAEDLMVGQFNQPSSRVSLVHNHVKHSDVRQTTEKVVRNFAWVHQGQVHAKVVLYENLANGEIVASMSELSLLVLEEESVPKEGGKLLCEAAHDVPDCSINPHHPSAGLSFDKNLLETLP